MSKSRRIAVWLLFAIIYFINAIFFSALHQYKDKRFLLLHDQYNTINALTFIYSTHARHVSAHIFGRHQVICTKI